MRPDVSSVPAIILAAGESRRMGTPKALLPFHGETFLDGLIGKLADHCDPVVVVLGCHADAIRSGTARPARFVVNAEWPSGMLSSLQCGLREIPLRAVPVMFTLVDHPNPSHQTVQQLLAAPPAPVVIPRYSSRKGHPVRLSRAVAEELLELPSGAKPTDVLHRHLPATVFLDVNDPGVVDDIDDRAAYEELLLRP